MWISSLLWYVYFIFFVSSLHKFTLSWIWSIFSKVLSKTYDERWWTCWFCWGVASPLCCTSSSHSTLLRSPRLWHSQGDCCRFFSLKALAITLRPVACFLVIIPFYLSIFGFPLSPAWLFLHPGNDGWISNPSGPPFFCDQIDGLVEKTRWLFVWLRQRLAGFGRWCRSIAWRISSREYAGDGGAAINELMREQPPRILVLSLKTRINPRESTPT